jgi:hypothetical protein
LTVTMCLPVASPPDWLHPCQTHLASDCQVLLMPAKPVESGHSLRPTLPCPMSYVGLVLSTIGGDCQPLWQVLQVTTAHESAAHRTACQRKQPCCRPGRHNVHWVPNLLDETIPSHPQSTMWWTSTPTMSDLTLAGAKQPGSLFVSISLPPTLHHCICVCVWPLVMSELL